MPFGLPLLPGSRLTGRITRLPEMRRPTTGLVRFRDIGVTNGGSSLPSLGRWTTTVYSGRGSLPCYEIKSVLER